MPDQDISVPVDRDALLGGDPSTELASNRTEMSFERTGAALDRTLMSVVRTSLSLIGFGFTLFQVFHSLVNKMPGALPTHAPRNFGLALIALGVVLLVLGLLNHVASAKGLETRRARLVAIGMIRHAKPARPSTITVIAILLLLLGVIAFANIVFRNGLFG
jgi:putative membrane protein